MIEFLQQNWQYVLVAFYILEKIVKLSPAAWDDILVDGIMAILRRLTGNNNAV
jgi:hypothetical protein